MHSRAFFPTNSLVVFTSFVSSSNQTWGINPYYRLEMLFFFHLSLTYFQVIKLKSAWNHKTSFFGTHNWERIEFFSPRFLGGLCLICFYWKFFWFVCFVFWLTVNFLKFGAYDMKKTLTILFWNNELDT